MNKNFVIDKSYLKRRKGKSLVFDVYKYNKHTLEYKNYLQNTTFLKNYF